MKQSEAFQSLIGSVENIVGRLVSLEKMPAPIAGPAGEKGEKGEPGESGADGQDGAPGEAGLPGEKGEKGEPGQPGENGLNGQDGVNGEDGLRGEKGEHGQDGKDADSTAIIAEVKSYCDGMIAQEVQKSIPVPVDEEDAAATFAMLLRKEFGDGEVIELPPPFLNITKSTPPQITVHVDAAPQSPRGVEKTVVTKHDERGRILAFERHSS